MSLQSAFCWKCCSVRKLEHGIVRSSQAYAQKLWKILPLKLDGNFLFVPIADQLEGSLENRSRARAIGFTNQTLALHLIK